MPLNGIEQNGLPLNNQIEICLFGKGFGECITIHLGNNYWVIIDSFLHPKTKKPIALEYFESLAVNTATQVRLVIVTHWHDDHIRGMSKIVEQTDAARVVFSQAVREDEFKKFIKRHQTKLMTASGSKVDEMDRVLEFFNNKPAHRLSPRLASQGKSLLELTPNEVGIPVPCKIQALSPSDTDVWAFMQTIAQMFPTPAKPKRPARKITQNHASVVTSVNYQDTAMLLGADMENSTGDDKGWNAVINSDSRPPKSIIYKIAHHGSATGHNADIWEQFLVNSPLAIMTPFINGKVQLPTIEQIKAMLVHTPNLFATGLPVEIKTKKRSAAVEKEIKNVKLRGLGAGLGAIRLRSMPITEGITECNWSVELFGHAQHL